MQDLDEYVMFPLSYLNLEEKINEQIKKNIELSNVIEKLEMKIILSNKQFIKYYYIDLQDVLNEVKRFHSLPFQSLKLLNIQSTNKLFMAKDFNVTLCEDIDALLGCIKFQTNNLPIKKIVFPIDSEEIDLSDKIVISKLRFDQFYNIKKVRLCRLQIKPPYKCRDQLYTIIPLNVNDIWKHSFDIEGRSYTDLH